MRYLHIFLLPFFIILLTGCDFGPDEEITSIDSDLNLLIAEAHQEVGAPSIVVYFETSENEPCSNSEIINNFEVSGDIIINNLEGILQPDFCASPATPATSLDYTELENGEYLLEVNYRDNSDLYHVTVATDSIGIEADHANFTNMLFDVAWRYPENSFAFLCGTLNGSANPCNDFEAILQDNLELEAFSFPDRGFTPYPDSTSGFGYNAPGLYYIYDSAADFDEAGSLLQGYDVDIQAAAAGVAIFLINWESRRFVIGQ